MQSAAGLGVTQFLDGNPIQVDGSPLLTSEYITFSSAWAVNVASVPLTVAGLLLLGALGGLSALRRRKAAFA